MTIEPLTLAAVEAIWPLRSTIARAQTNHLTPERFYDIAVSEGAAYVVLTPTPVAMFGFTPGTLASQSAVLWFVGTTIMGHSVRVIREMRRALESLTVPYLCAESDCGRWLELLGFMPCGKTYWRSKCSAQD